MNENMFREWVIAPVTMLGISVLMLILAAPVLQFVSWLIEFISRTLVGWLLALLLLVFPRAAVRIGRRIWSLLLVGILIWTAYFLRNLPEESPLVWAVLEEFLRVLWLPVVLGLLGLLIAWASASSQTLFYLRQIKPLREVAGSLRGSVLVLGQIPLLGGVIKHLRNRIEEVKESRCRGLLILLFYLSIFTLPVKVFPLLDDYLYVFVGPHLEKFLLLIPWLPAKYAEYLSHGFVYLFDWVFLVACCYAIIKNLSTFIRQNLFDSVQEAISYFVTNARVKAFTFAGYFARTAEGSMACAVASPTPSLPAPWLSFTEQLHAETERLDQFLVKTWHGGNSRVAVVFSGPDVPGKPLPGCCVHYRRFGKCGFLVAVDDDLKRFAEGDSESQENFQQLALGMGRLINVRDSLK